MSQEIEKGTVVKLKSGGSPPMTCLDDPNTEGTVTCQWFDGKELKHGTFNIAGLCVIEDEDRPGFAVT